MDAEENGERNRRDKEDHSSVSGLWDLENGDVWKIMGQGKLEAGSKCGTPSLSL